MRFYPANLDALLVELSNLDETLALFESLQQMPIFGVEGLDIRMWAQAGRRSHRRIYV